MLTVKVGSDHALRRLLANHPRVDKWVPGESDATLEWEENGRVRRIYTARPDVALKGVVELVDNNPLVCADAFSVPGPASTLALLALGPALDAGIVIERPTLLTNVETSEDEIAPFLETVGWTSGITVMGDAVDMEGAIAATAICAIKTPERLEDLDDLYDERYSRSFFVRRDESAEWHVNLIREKPWAAYRLRISPDMPYSLLTIQIMADLQGKCGAAQVVHAFNVMCGFEESLGIAE
jgi:N-acetyl-gamma-glutamylphosphate reductase